MGKLLTVGMATYDDFDGVYFSIQSLKMFHKICNSDDVEIIVVDNNPDSPHGQATASFMNWVSNGKYIPYKYRSGTAIRNEVFRNASGKYTICMDSHVMFFNNSIDTLLNYYKSNPNCKNIIQGPLIYDDLKSPSTHFVPSWSSGMYGQWATDYEGLQSNQPFEIPMQGLGVFSCETENWVGFNKHFKGFGGEEGYIHQKFRQLGGKSLCLPDFKWLHRFGRPSGIKYRLVLEDRIWNYFVGWLELTQDPNHQMIKDIYTHFKDQVPPGSIDNILKQAINKIII